MTIAPTSSSSCCFNTFCCPCILVQELVSKVCEVFDRALESHLFWGVVLVGALAKFTFVVLTGGLAIKGAGVYLLFGALVVVLYVHHYWPELRHEIMQIVRLIENWAREYKWISEVIPGKLYLSGLPRKNFGDIETVKREKNVTKVISMNELHELRKRTIPVEPVTPKDWKEHAIPQTIHQVPDFHGVPPDTINKGVEEIRREILRPKGAVLVHCLSGKGRSASIVTGYLLKYCGKRSVDEAHAYLRRIRPQVSLNTEQIKSLTEYFDKYVKK